VPAENTGFHERAHDAAATVVAYEQLPTGNISVCGRFLRQAFGGKVDITDVPQDKLTSRLPRLFDFS